MNQLNLFYLFIGTRKDEVIVAILFYSVLNIVSRGIRTVRALVLGN